MVKTRGIIGAVLFGVGLMAGFVPLSGGSYDCGSAFVPSSDEQARGGMTKWADAEHGLLIEIVDMPESRCDDLRWLVRIPAFGLVGAGGIVLVRRWYVATRSAGRARAG
ncbi:hypothetical protein [Actinopolymorpha sp. B9G3]|uniref:hypothetical protein n=1 Tax=Actinopolymorpha sp. B9G3 TaxID=3158970 RepID=UPI0032D8D9E8